MMSELSREQVEHTIQLIIDHTLRGWKSSHEVQMLLDHDATLRAKLQAQTKRAEKASVEFALFRFKIADLTAKLEASEQECASWRIVLNNEREAAQKKLEAMTQERDLFRKSMKERLDDYGSACEREQVIKQQLAAIEQRFQAAELVAMQTLLTRSQQQLAASEQRFQAAENERIEWVQRGERAEQRAEDIEANLDHYREEATSLRASCHTFEQQLAEAQAMIAELETREKAGHTARALHLKKCEDIGELQATIARLELQFCAAGKYADEMMVERDQLQATITAQQEEIGRLRSRIELLTASGKETT